MRIRITERLTGSIDGIQLDRFRVGETYDMGTTLASYLMAVGSAVPVTDERVGWSGAGFDVVSPADDHDIKR